MQLIENKHRLLLEVGRVGGGSRDARGGGVLLRYPVLLGRGYDQRRPRPGEAHLLSGSRRRRIRRLQRGRRSGRSDRIRFARRIHFT